MLDDGSEPVALDRLDRLHLSPTLIAKDLMEHGADRRQVTGSLRLRYSDQEPFLAAARRDRR